MRGKAHAIELVDHDRHSFWRILSNVCFGKWNLIYFPLRLERNLIKRKSENNSRNLCHLSSWNGSGMLNSLKNLRCFYTLLNFFLIFTLSVFTLKKKGNRKEYLCQSSPPMSMWCYKLNFSANLFPSTIGNSNKNTKSKKKNTMNLKFIVAEFFCVCLFIYVSFRSLLCIFFCWRFC